MKYSASVDGRLTVEFTSEEVHAMDIVPTGENSWHVLVGGRSFNIIAESVNPQDATCILRINGKNHTIKLSDEMDALLDKMGMSAQVLHKIREVTSPMPGLVLRVAVAAGQPVHKGDTLCILEAMKMENVIKASGDGVVKEICVTGGDAVQKGQVLIRME